jgi:hypothetical protein
MPGTPTSAVHPAVTMPAIELSKISNGQQKHDVQNGGQNYKSEKPSARRKYFWMFVILSALLFIACILTGIIVHYATKSTRPQCTLDDEALSDTTELAPIDIRL